MLKDYSHPEKIILVGYLTIILIGTLFLTLPIATSGSVNISFIDALFTSTSAVCVTGLIVTDTQFAFSPFGKLIILFLLQLGGLGYMTISTALMVLINKKLSGFERYASQDEFQRFTIKDIKSFVIKIIIFTLTSELIGAILLFPKMNALFNDFWKSLWFSIFHSVSAFCNAGFSIFSQNLIVFKEDVYVNIVIALMIIIGGFGFIALGSIHRYVKTRGKDGLSVHTKIVGIVTLCLIIIPFILFIFIERNNALQNLSLIDKLATSFFQIVTPRTAGFNTLNISGLQLPTLFLFMILMFIGGSPGGTAGGVKTTTIFTVMYSMFEKIRGKNNVNIFFKRISDIVILKSFFIFSLSIIVIFFGVFLLLLSESKSFFSIMFEVFSAYGTVGLSFGSGTGNNYSLSGDFTNLGKIIIIIIMFTGRVGIMTAANAFILKTRKETVKYPKTKIIVG